MKITERGTPQLIDIKQMAKLFGVSEKTILRRCRDGSLLSPIRFGGLLRWDLRDVREWIAAQKPSG